MVLAMTIALIVTWGEYKIYTRTHPTKSEVSQQEKDFVGLSILCEMYNTSQTNFTMTITKRKYDE